MTIELPQKQKKSRKVLWTTLAVLFIAVSGVWFFKAELLSFAITAKTGVRVSLSSWEISLSKMRFKEFAIHTPKDPVYPKAFTIDEITINAGLFDMLKQSTHIKSIDVDGVFLGINIRPDGSSNWAPVIQKFASGDSESSDSSDEEEKSSSTFIIDDFKVNNVRVGVTTPKGKNTYGPTSIHLESVGAHQKMTLDGLIRTVVVEISTSMVRKYAIPLVFKGITKSLGKSLLAPFKFILPKRNKGPAPSEQSTTQGGKPPQAKSQAEPK